MKDDKGEKWGIFQNVDTGKTIEKDFNQLVVHPPAKPWNEPKEAGLTDSSGLIDVNPYTLQHKKYENIFAFGSGTNIPTTRSAYATQAQTGIIKHNVLQYLNGEDLNAIYDGYSFIPLYLGTRYMTSFAHFYNQEPHPRNHMIPHYGLFSRLYFMRYKKIAAGQAKKYAGFKKNYGPPHWHYNPRYDELEHNEYLNKHGIDPEVTKFKGEHRVVQHAGGHHH